MRRAAAIASCVALLAAATAAQTAPDTAGLSAWLRFDDPGPFEALFTWYPPLFIRNGIGLKDFIRSDAFAAFRKKAGDARAVDAIYVRAMSLTANNTAAALLLATVATLDHYTVGVRVPFLNLFFPLSNESYGEYAARVRNLPADFYADTPPGDRGDRDKLQHFFGSAFIAMTFESRGAARRVGDFIEFGEDAVIVDGMPDSRDARANWNGSEFGIALLADNRRYPSGFFLTPVVGRSGDGAGRLAGRTTGRATDHTTGCR
ncbi:MAG TPA: hypothetical protein VI932_09950 [Bacteroidota bacterium]|nr:hypothetical protein [Bacteroidota bacterium]